MKIRAVTLGLDLSADILLQDPSLQFIDLRLKYARKTLNDVQRALESKGYTVQTSRVAFNSFAEWLLPLVPVLALASSDDESRRLSHEAVFEDLAKKIDQMLIDNDIHFCSFGSVSRSEHFPFVSLLIRSTTRVSATIALDPPALGMAAHTLVAPDHDLCVKAAEECIKISGVRLDEAQERHDNFRFCVSFQAPKNSPFFPVACHASGRPATLSIGLENGDLIFLACFAAESLTEARDNLLETLVQAVSPIQSLLRDFCQEHGLVYGGVDASINPGLAPQDSVVQGLEHALQFIFASAEEKEQLKLAINWPPSSASSVRDAPKGAPNASNTQSPTSSRFFGSMGTLSAVSCLTSALKMLGEQPVRGSDCAERILTCGYNGLMLPVMEDLTLAARAAAVSAIPPPESAPAVAPTGVSLRDLLVFSCVCGVGLDTVPIAGSVTAEGLAAVYSEVGTLSYRLSKPLTCRVLPMKGLSAGQFTTVPENPFLVNTRVFSIE